MVMVSMPVDSIIHRRKTSESGSSCIGAYNVYYVKLNIWLSIQTLSYLTLIAPAVLFPAPLILPVSNEQTSYQPTGYALHIKDASLC
jgi:hypothetical protein